MRALYGRRICLRSVDEHARHDVTKLGGPEFSLIFRSRLAILNRGENGRVGRRAADTFSRDLDQRTLPYIAAAVR